ncbi:MAG: hypothetical protein GX790_08575 [Syntrophomonadaceae bacterium]|nr:hypothetical protein [Syntrophomonadaceae bacterium]
MPVDADYLPVYLIDDRIYYIDKEMNICFYDLRTLENTNVVKLDYSPVSLASNGKDIVWNYDSKSYWYAGLLDFKLEGIQELVEKGDIFQLSLVALYTNKQLADVTEGAKWYSSNGEVIAIEGGWCEALSSGTAIVTVEYEGQQLSTPIVVREAMKLEIFPQKAELPRGAIEQFKAYLVYSDGSRVDVTNEAVWVSELNVIEKGLYRADKLGIDNIEVHYDDFNASLTIVINDLDYKEPDEPKDDEPQPKTKPKSSSNQTRHDNIDEGVPVFKAAQFDEIVRGESCYFDIIRLCLKLLFPYPLGWEI